MKFVIVYILGTGGQLAYPASSYATYVIREETRPGQVYLLRFIHGFLFNISLFLKFIYRIL